MPSAQAKIINKILQMTPKDPPGIKHDYAAERARNEAGKLPELPRDMMLEPVDFEGISGEILSPVSDAAGMENPNENMMQRILRSEEPVVWYIHGGGFTTGSAKERRALTQYLAAAYHIPCIATNYRLSPENKWPAQLDDCMKVYDCLCKTGVDPKRLVLMGESAGGTLALSVALRLAMEGKTQPKAIAAFSPCTEQAVGFPSHRKNVATDYMLGDALNRSDQYEAVFGIEGPKGYEDMLKDPLISPYYGDYSKLPPIFLAASDVEVLYDDARLLYEKLKREGHDVFLDVKEGVCHAYPVFPMMPEAKETIAEAMEFALRK